MVDKAEIAAELIRRGVSPDEIAAAGFGQVAQQGRTGMIAPRFTTGNEKADQAIVGDQGKKLNADRDALGRAFPVISQLDRFSELNQEQRTGGIQHQTYGDSPGERWNPLNIPGMVGHAFASRDPQFQEMSGIASVLQGQARPAGSGATSDFEQRLYRQGVPSPDKQGRVNQSIIEYQRGVVAEESDRLAFNEDFFRRNGSLNGAQEAWGRYVAANPYTRPSKGGRSEPNAKRQAWREYFGVAPQPARRAPTPASKPAGRQKGFSGRLAAPQRAKAVELLRGGARNHPSGSEMNPYAPANPAEFRAIKPGQWFIDDDGSVHRKGG